MAIFHTDSGSLRDLKVLGSTLMSASTGLAAQVKSSGSTIFSISGSGGEIFNVSDIGSSTALFTISSGSTTIVNVDNTKKVTISGSLQVTGSAYIKGLTTTAQANFVSIDTASGQLYTAGTGSFTASYAVSSSYATSASYAVSSSYAVSASYAATASNMLGGANNYIPLWTGSTQLSSSVIYQSGSNIGIGTGAILPNYKLHVSGTGVSGSLNVNDILTVSSSRVKVSGSHTITGSLAVSGLVNIKGLSTSVDDDLLVINISTGVVTTRDVETLPTIAYFASYYSTASQVTSPTSPYSASVKLTLTLDDGIQETPGTGTASYGVTLDTSANSITNIPTNDGWYDVVLILNVVHSTPGDAVELIIKLEALDGSTGGSTWREQLAFSRFRNTITNLYTTITCNYRLAMYKQHSYRFIWYDEAQKLSLAGDTNIPSSMVHIRYVRDFSV